MVMVVSTVGMYGRGRIGTDSPLGGLHGLSNHHFGDLQTIEQVEARLEREREKRRRYELRNPGRKRKQK